MTRKNRKKLEISCFEVLDVLFLDVLNGGLGMNKLKFLLQKNISIFLQFFIIKTLDQEPD
jgi:hypothetical protein